MTMWMAILLLLLAAGATTAVNTSDCVRSCDGVDIPYPFGVGAGCFRKGFEIECAGTGPVLAGTTIPVVNLTVDPAESLVILPVGWECYNATSDSPRSIEDYSYGETDMNKDGVYRISSTHNMLVVLGCNTMGYTASGRDGGGQYYRTYYTGCMSYCNDSSSAQDGLYAGVGCCHVDIPSGLTDNNFNFQPYDHTFMMDYAPCEYAFLVDRTKYTFSRSHLAKDKNRTSPVWLDWAIRGNSSGGENGDILSCKKDAKSTIPDYACCDHSDCVNSTNGPGYNCTCSSGYQGNAYVAGGCVDIDECAHPDEYRCYGICKNIEGSHKCDCPRGYRSDDPTTQQCTRKFPLVAQISIGAISGILLLAFLSFILVLRNEKRKNKEFYKKNGGSTLENAEFIKIYKKDDLKPILKSSNIIGKGGFSEVYKGALDKVLVAVKKPIGGNALQNQQFPNEVIIQSQVIHKNIVRLVGCCLEVDTPMLVYEFISKGSLDSILESKEPLSLDVRLNILKESAHGLDYMHSQARTKILHGDVKPGNILLDENFVPRISDFGISRLMARDREHTTLVIGDKTYMDPVYLQTGLLTEKSDVYSFGVVILEVISRRKATYSDNNSLVRGFLECHQKGQKATALFDEEIATTPGDLELLDSLTEIAVECLNLDAEQRLSMKEVAERLLMLHRSRA
ncbi:unnamed protein product [Alopecurus aequalis]